MPIFISCLLDLIYQSTKQSCELLVCSEWPSLALSDSVYTLFSRTYVISVLYTLGTNHGTEMNMNDANLQCIFAPVFIAIRSVG